jgi:signal transduction histidine kinase
MNEDAETLEQLQVILQREGYHVMVAVDGSAGLRLAQSVKPDLIISDLLLAGLSGHEVWKLLRANRETADIPILVISDLAVPPPNRPWRPNINAEWQFLSYTTFLPKPVDLRRLSRVVKRLLTPDEAGMIPGGPSVIIATADQTLYTQMSTLLSDHDFGVKISSSLDEALQLARATPPAILLVDYRRPDEKIRSIVLEAKQFAAKTAIILIAGPGVEIEPEVESYYDALLVTPFAPSYAIRVITQAYELVTLRKRTEALSIHLLATNQDLLDTQEELQAQNEELRHTNAALIELDSLKEMFIGMVVHDLKAPLGAMLTTLNFLLTDPSLPLSPLAETLLTGALAAGNQALRLVETLLEEQRLENGRMKPELEDVDLKELIEISIQQASPLLALHHVETKFISADDLPLVYADPHISQRIMENLLDNAIKFSPKNSTITIHALPKDNFVRVRVTDQGPGIPKAEQEIIFERFTQLKSSASATRAGFGLGLTFCHLATHAMNGSIWVESDGESGTSFFFTLPIYNEDNHHPE